MSHQTIKPLYPSTGSCQCNMSAKDMDTAKQMVLYAIESALVSELKEQVLKGNDPAVLTMIACGLPGFSEMSASMQISPVQAQTVCQKACSQPRPTAKSILFDKPSTLLRRPGPGSKPGTLGYTSRVQNMQPRL